MGSAGQFTLQLWLIGPAFVRYADAGMDHKEGGCYMFRLDKTHIIDATVRPTQQVVHDLASCTMWQNRSELN